MLNKSILFSVFVLCISCNDTRNPQDYSSQEEDTMIALVDPDTNNAVQRIGPQNENKTVNGVEEIIAEKGSLKLTFNKNDRVIKLLYHDSTYTLGSFFNTLGYPPNIEFVSIHKNEGIVIVSLVEQLGMVEYQITLFEFDPTHNALYKHCNFSGISIHNTEMDTLENIKHYDYKIQGNQFLIDEYYPYKSTQATSKYVVKSKSCFLNKGNRIR